MQPADPESRRPLRNEVWTALAIVFGATFLLAIVQWVLPFTAGFMQVGLALVLLEVPLWLLVRRGLATRGTPGAAEAQGLMLHLGPWRQGLALGLGTVALVFPIFIGGFHLAYTEVLGRPAEWRLDRLARWSEDLEFAPGRACGRSDTSIWSQESDLWITAPPQARLEVRLTTPADLPPVETARLVRCAPGAALPTLGAAIRPDPSGTFRPPKGMGIHLDLGERWSFELDLRDAGAPIPADRIRLGHQSITASDDGRLENTRDYWWLLAYLLIHLGLVAYPEEYFFRGYLLPRLDQLLGKPRRLMGVAVGWGLVLSSLAFALLHPILIPGPHRLLVFFPALLFGWLALKQRQLGAAVLVHALSNVCLAIVSRMYA